MNNAERRRSLAAAISSIAVFGIGIGVGAPLLSLMLEARGTDSSLTGLNGAATFVGVMLGPLVTPRLVARFGFRNLLLAALPLSLGLFLLLKPFDNLAVWFGLRLAGGIVGSSIFTATEAWISQLAGAASRGRIVGIYAASLSGGFALGPLILDLTGIAGWAPFLALAVIQLVAMLPLLAAPGGTVQFEATGSHPVAIMARMKPMILMVIVFGVYEAATLSLVPVWGSRVGLGTDTAAALLSAIYIGSIALQVPIGWLSDRAGRTVALRLCGIVGLTGALALPWLGDRPTLLLVVLFLWGGFATGIYPVALSLTGDLFRDSELVNANAALVVAYGVGAFVGPILGGAAMDVWNPHGIAAILAAMFVVLIVMTLRRGDGAGARPKLAALR
jgi:MFS family permease